MRKQAEMSIEVKENGQYVEHIAYPYVEYDHVTFENGMQIEKALEDDVAMPTVAHDTSSFKVGQGDSDVSDSIVDSSIASMTIKGQTYQNILPSPTLRNSMTDGNTMQKINEGYDSVEVVDGNVKSAILKGQTLVNICKPYEFDIQTTGSGLRHIYDKKHVLNIPIQDDKQYSIWIEIDINEIGAFSLSHTGAISTLVFNDIVGLTLTHGSTIIYPCVKRSNSTNVNFSIGALAGSTEGRLKGRIMVFEGDIRGFELPYFTGMQSVKMPVLTTFNTYNIFNPNNTEDLGTYDCLTLDYYPVEIGTKLSTTSLSGGTYWSSLYLYDENKTLIQSNFGDANRVEATFTISNPRAKFVRFKCPRSRKHEVILNYGDIKPYEPYTPYKSNILTVNEEVELRGVGDVKDELDLLTGEVAQRVGKTTITGDLVSSVMSPGHNNNSETICFERFGGIIPFQWNQIISADWPISNDGYNSSLTHEYFNPFDGYGIFRIKRSRLETEDVNGFKKWLNENPITIYHPVIGSESIKTVDLSILNQDNQPVEQLQSYANGYIQVSSQEGTLIPTTEYEVPTSNSYHADLMKPNAQYTMKNMQGTFTIDDIQYNASANGTFTTPSTLTNKFMVTSVAQSQPMLLEGDMTSEEVPYVEGIKSAFDGVDKVEIYSVGKNLFDGEMEIGRYNPYNGIKEPYNTGTRSVNFIKVEPNTTYTFSRQNLVTGYITLFWYDKNKKFLNYTAVGITPTRIITTSENCHYITFNFEAIEKDSIQIEESPTSTTYEPYKSNTTSFPITNPLRSLPNGVRDEIVLDRMSNKVKLIQRVSEDLTQLETPIVTQVDIEGFPYVYKDGHIFLNTEVAPTTEVRYSINQSQIIESQSEDIVRHSKEIDNLYNLIATYVQVNYDSTLLNLKTKGV